MAATKLTQKEIEEMARTNPRIASAWASARTPEIVVEPRTAVDEKEKVEPTSEIAGAIVALLCLAAIPFTVLFIVLNVIAAP